MSWETYAGVSGASAAWNQLDVISHNLANMSTTGFKSHKVTFQVAQGPNFEGVMGQAYVEGRTSGADLSDGSLHKTDNDLDIALQGEGWLAVETPSGETMLTRSGNFVLDDQGFVITRDGNKLLSSGGPVQLQPGDRLVVGEDGALRTDKGADLGMLSVLSGDVEPVGGTLWKATGPTEDVVMAQQSVPPGTKPRVTVLQNHLERSNVDPLSTMVELIEASHFFEAYQNIMKSSDEADSRLIQAGRG